MTQRRLRRQSSVVVLALAVLTASAILPSPARASTVLYRTDAELVAASDRVVYGRVLRQRFERPDGPSGSIFTVSVLAVLEDFTGVAGEAIEIWELGGVMGNEVMWVGGGVTYDIGSEVLVCLERGRFGYRSIAMGFSKFDIQLIATADGTLDGRLTRNMRETNTVGAPALQQRERTLAEFRALTSSVRGSRALRNHQADLMQPDSSSSAGFTFLGPSRWTEADSGIPVKWYINTTAPTPLIGGNGVAELQSALAAWTNPTSASIILNYSGTTSQSNPKGGWLPSTGTGVLTFEDPNNEISGFTLAIGGGGWFANQDVTVNGQVFHSFAYGYVIFANAVDLSDSFRQSQNYARVLEHEIGHTIGLGHSNAGTNNIMYPSCCAGDTPIAPNIGPDDLAGLNFIYPVSAPPPPPPPPPCSYQVSPTTRASLFVGASTSVSVTTGAGCTWSANSNASFVTLTGGSNGTGNGVVSFTVARNTRTIARSGTLTVAGTTVTVNQGGAPMSGDYDGDRVADLALFRPGNGNWMLRLSPTFASGPDLQWGAPGDKPVRGDYDGDGLSDIAVWRPSTGIWFVIFSSTGALVQVQWGSGDDVPMPADYTGDGRTEIAVWRPGTGVWYIYDLTTGTYTSQQWGASTDIPLTGDYDSDGKADIAAFRPSTGYWYVLHSSTPTYAAYQWGGGADIPVPADYNGDGRTDIAVFRPSNGYWYVYDLTTSTYGAYQWGSGADIPAPRDYNGDGGADIAVWRPQTGQWFIYYIATGAWQAVTHGASGDAPIR